MLKLLANLCSLYSMPCRLRIGLGLVVCHLFLSTPLCGNEIRLKNSKVVVLDGKFKDSEISSALSYFVDENNQYSFEQISSGQSSISWVDQPERQSTKGTAWMRFHVKFSADEEFMLRVSFARHDSVIFYRMLSNGEWIHAKAGSLYPMSEQEIPNKDPVFYLGSNGQKIQTFYVAIQGAFQFTTPIVVYSSESYRDFDRTDQAFFGLYAGVIIVMVLYNLFLFFSTRDVGYLYYSGTILTIFGGLLPYLNGTIQQYVFPDSPLLRQRFGTYSACLGISFFCLNSMSINDTKVRAKYMHKLLQAALVLSAAYFIAAILFYHPVMRFGVAGFGVFIKTFSFFVGCRVSVTGYRPSQIYVLGWMGLVFGIIGRMLQLFGFVSPNVFLTNGMYFGAIVETVLLSFALAYKINLLKQETVLAQERMNKLKDEFLANTSHELRTPLNGIVGLTEALIEGAHGKITKNVKNDLKMIISASRRLLSLVNDILDFSKLKNHNLSVDCRPVSLASVAEVTVAMLTPMATSKKLKLINNISNDVPSVYADENRLQQIFYNIVGNAIKYSDEGSITLEAEALKGQVYFSVRDEGIGIPEGKIDRIFNSFEQLDGTSGRRQGGTGLGLAVTKQLVELMEGKILVESQLGKGSTFKVYLPRSLEKAKPKNTVDLGNPVMDFSTDIQTESRHLKSLGGRTFDIMAVDDEPLNLQVLERQLVSQGHKVRLISSGQDAINSVEKDGVPDLISLDIMMPRMTGYEVTKRLRERHSGIELPIVLLTAKNQVEDLVKGLNAGANDFIVKPFSKTELAARIQGHLNLKITSAEATETKLAKARVEHELLTAGAVQETLLPETLDVCNARYSYHYQPAEQTGGDWFSHYHDKPGERLFIFVGDVVGHGIASALVTGVTCGAILSFMNTEKNTQNENTEELVYELLNSCNGAILQTGARANRMMAMSVLVLHLNTGKVGYSNAALCPVIRVGDGVVKRHVLPGPILGTNKNPEFHYKEFNLEKGDKLLLYSDGLLENEGPDNKVLRSKEITQICKEHRGNASDLLGAILRRGAEIWQVYPAEDDCTVVAIEWLGAADTSFKKSA